MRIYHVGLMVFALCFGFAALPAHAEDSPAAAATTAPAEIKQVTIAVVDIEKLLSASKAAQSVKSQVEEKRKTFLADVEKAEKDLRDSQKAIEEESKKLSKEELVKKAQAFEAKRLEARKSIQDRKSKLDQAYTETMNVLTKSIYDVCEKIAAEKKIDLVITRQNIIVGSMSLDITAEVLQRLDVSLPKLDLKAK